jgi:hypothetical protein
MRQTWGALLRSNVRLVFGGSKSFEVRYDLSQPSSGGGFRFFKSSEAIVGIDGEASRVQRNVAAGNFLTEAIGRDESCHHTAAAGARVFDLAEIEACRGVFEDKLLPRPRA